MSSLGSRLELSDDVRLEEVALNAQHFTGADLQALLYTAQLKAIHLELPDGPTVDGTGDDSICFARFKTIAGRREELN